MNQWLLAAFEAVTGQIDSTDQQRPADQALRAYFSSQPGIGARDRRLIADRCFDMLRHLRRDQATLELAGQAVSTQNLVWLADERQTSVLAADDAQRAQMLQAVQSVDHTQLSQAQRLSLPDWLAESIAAAMDGADIEPLASRLLEPAALDIRVNTDKTNRNTLQQKLADTGIEFVEVQSAIQQFMPDTALRVSGHPALEHTEAFRSGLFEIQDAGSQVLARLAGVRRGQTVVDFCAGGGGKALAFAAMMRNEGNIYCCDVSQRRLGAITPRMNRAGVTCIRPLAIRDENDASLDRLRGRADVVFVDAPCSGTGTLRRNPGIKWQLNPDEIAELAANQRSILRAASTLVRPGGRLIYATCSILYDENEAIATDFESKNPNHERLNLADHSAFSDSARPTANVPGTGFIRIWPHIDNCDAYFVAGWRSPRE
jgi:16S rRNA (cytosine967-C5)-methyltransferase